MAYPAQGRADFVSNCNKREPNHKLICDKCRAGQMVEYQREIRGKNANTTIFGRRCERCGYIQLDSDDDVWSAVGL